MRMTGRSVQRFFWLLMVLMLTGCAASWKQVPETNKPFKGPSRAYVVNLPAQWKRAPTEDTDQLMLTKEGLFLQRISVLRYKFKDALPTIQQARALDVAGWSDLLPEELADWQYKQMRAGTNVALVIRKDELKGILAAFQPHDARPADPTTVQVRVDPFVLDGRPVYELETRSFNAWGLEYRTLTYGFVHDKAYWVLQYTAPKLYFFDRDLPVFEAFRASFKIKEPCFLFCSD